MKGLATALALAAVLALAACAPESVPQVEAPPLGPPPQATMEPIAEPPAPPAPPRPAHKPQAPAVSASAIPVEPSPEPVPVPATATASRGLGDFERLIGLDQSATAELLGEPKQRAESPPATIWRYLSRDCELDVYFYLDLQAKEMRTLHYEVRNHDDAAERPQQRCYDELVSQRQPPLDSNGSTNRPD